METNMNAQAISLLEEVEAQLCRDLINALSETERISLSADVLDVGGATVVLMGSDPDNMIYNHTMALGLRGPVTGQDLSDIGTAAQAHGLQQLTIGVPPGTHASELEALLIQRGSAPAGVWLALSRDTRPVQLRSAGGEAPPEGPKKWEIKEVGASDAQSFLSIITPCFGLSADAELVLRATFGCPGWHHYVVFQEGAAAACGSLYLAGEVGYLGFDGTLPEYRKQGMQTALIAWRVQHAAEAGASLMFTHVIEGSPEHPNPSENNMRRSEFNLAFKRSHYMLPTA